MEVSHCECCHADGDPGVLQRGGREKKEGSKKRQEQEKKRVGEYIFRFLNTESETDRLQSSQSTGRNPGR